MTNKQSKTKAAPQAAPTKPGAKPDMKAAPVPGVPMKPVWPPSAQPARASSPQPSAAQSQPPKNGARFVPPVPRKPEPMKALPAPKPEKPAELGEDRVPDA